MRKAILFALHAEQLHDDRVWRTTRRVARAMAEREQRATLFVYPFRSEVAGYDIAERIRELAAMGHEIAQHSHFYEGMRIAGAAKRNDLSPGNVRHCIERDRGYLDRNGFRPRGFTAGSFIVTAELVPVLAELGFEYDCSVCYPKPNGWRVDHGEVFAEPRTENGLVRQPTLCSVGEWFKWGRKAPVEHPVVFIHDYDLVVPRHRALWWLLLRTTGPTVPIGEHTTSLS